MFMIKWIICICAVLLCFAACAKKGTSHFEEWAQEDRKLRVLSTTAMIDDLVGQIGKDRIAHICLIQGEIDPHSYELVKGDEEKISLASVVFYNGLGLEHGASLRYHMQHHPRAIAIGDAIVKGKPDAIVMIDNQTDPHIWMDVSLWMQAIDPIVDALTLADPAGKEEYQKNGEILRQRCRQCICKLCAILHYSRR